MDNGFASVGGIVLRGGDVLLVRHTYGGAAGKLLNPSGMIQQGELPVDALKREILEETGVTINPLGVLAIRCSSTNWWLIFLAEHISGEPRTDNIENSQALYMPIQEALSRADVTDATKVLIKLIPNNKLLLLNKEYSALPTNEGRVMYS